MHAKVLVAGATGLLGSEICEKLVQRGHEVRALVRPTSEPARVARLKSLGIDLVTADLKAPESLEKACRGVGVVVCTASSTLSHQPGDSIETVDRDGLRNLVDAAKKEHVNRFVFTSLSGNMDESSPLQDAKRSVEQHVKQSGLEYTILRPSYFMEVWLSPAVGFNVAASTAVVYGKGDRKLSWISFRDVAEFAVSALESRSTWNRVLELGGPETLSPLDVVKIFERATGRTFAVTHVPEETLRKQFDTATDSLQQSFAALMIDYANGDEVPMAEVLREFPVNLTSVEQYARGVAKSTRKG